MKLLVLSLLLASGIPILGWHGVAPDDYTEVFPLMKEAGFDGYLAKVPDRTVAFKMLDAAQAAGLKAMPGFPELNASPETVVPLIRNHPALMAYYLKDEPETWDLDSLGSLVRRIQAIDSDIPCYINLYPNWAWQEENYVEHINMFTDKCPVPFISFDQYPVTEKEGGIVIRPTWYRNLEEIRKLCRERGKPMWAFALLESHYLGSPSSPDAFYPVPTLGHLRLQVFSDLAYGAQAIQYYTFRGAVGRDCKKTPVFDIVKQVNTEIKGLSSVFLGCEVIDVWHWGSIPKGTKPLNGSPDPRICTLSIDGMGAVVSLLKNGGRRYLAIVNKDCVHNTTIHLKISGNIFEVSKNGGRLPFRARVRELEPGDMIVLDLGLTDDGSAVVPVVPYPCKVDVREGYISVAGASISVADELACKSIDDFSVNLRASSGNVCDGTRIVFRHNRKLALGAYAISIKPGKVIVNASSVEGARYALSTLLQLLPPELYVGEPCERSRIVLPEAEIKDRPRFVYRGLELDCSRHFFSLEEVKKFLDIMAVYKLNRFHWHLTDDHGWRVEIKKYPRLTEVGAWRDATMVGWDPNHLDGIRHGGFYTQDELREVVAYAQDRGIEIMPEIDLPAHIVSALAAYPELGCTGGPYELMKVWDIAKDILCAGKESTFSFLDDVFSEICGIFPYGYIHIGGDECPKDRWRVCPSCQARIAELGLKDTDSATAEQYLQNYVTSRVQHLLEAKGRKVVGWDEILEGDLAPGATIMSWRGIEGGIKAAADGFDVIMTPVNYCYLDYLQSENRVKEPEGPYHYLTLETCYSFDPVAGLDELSASRVLGVQGNLWTEFISEPEHLEYMLLPRLLAIAEDGWSQPGDKDFRRFRNDIVSHQESIFNKIGLNYRQE